MTDLLAEQYFASRNPEFMDEDAEVLAQAKQEIEEIVETIEDIEMAGRHIADLFGEAWCDEAQALLSKAREIYEERANEL